MNNRRNSNSNRYDYDADARRYNSTCSEKEHADFMGPRLKDDNYDFLELFNRLGDR